MVSLGFLLVIVGCNSQVKPPPNSENQPDKNSKSTGSGNGNNNASIKITTPTYPGRPGTSLTPTMPTDANEGQQFQEAMVQGYCKSFLKTLNIATKSHLAKHFDTPKLYEIALGELVKAYEKIKQQGVTWLPDGYRLQHSTYDDSCAGFAEVAEVIRQRYKFSSLNEASVKMLFRHGLVFATESMDIASKYVYEGKEEGTTKKKYFGAGLEFYIPTKMHYQNPQELVILEPYDCSPFSELQAGDVITAINDQTVASKTLEEINELFTVEMDPKKTPKAPKIQLTVRRGTAEAEKITAELKLDCLPHVAYALTFADFHLGYIKIKSFLQEESVESLLEHFDEFEKDNQIGGLILDLRGNLGGSVGMAAQLFDAFVDQGIFVNVYNSATPWVDPEASKDQKMTELFRAKNPKQVFSKPVFILVDEFTASAAELLAAGLQAYGVAVVIGNETIGKAIGQLSVELNEKIAADPRFVLGGELSVTLKRFFPADGYEIQRRGVKRDLPIDDLVVEKVQTEYKARRFRDFNDDFTMPSIPDGVSMPINGFVAPYHLSDQGIEDAKDKLTELTASDDFCKKHPDCVLFLSLEIAQAYLAATSQETSPNP